MFTTFSVSNRLLSHHMLPLFKASTYHLVLLVLVCGIANHSQSLAVELKLAVIVHVLAPTTFVQTSINV
jgi:hypothetical protein